MQASENPIFRDILTVSDLLMKSALVLKVVRLHCGSRVPVTTTCVAMPISKILVLLSLPLAAAHLSAAPDLGIFINAKPTTHTSPDIYRNGWIDLNKNGVKAPCENPALPAEIRIDDLPLAHGTEGENRADGHLVWGPARGEGRSADSRVGQGVLEGRHRQHRRAHEGSTGWTNNLQRGQYALPWAAHARAINEALRCVRRKHASRRPRRFFKRGHPQPPTYQCSGVSARDFRRLHLEHLARPRNHARRGPRGARPRLHQHLRALARPVARPASHRDPCHCVTHKTHKTQEAPP